MASRPIGVAIPLRQRSAFSEVCVPPAPKKINTAVLSEVDCLHALAASALSPASSEYAVSAANMCVKLGDAKSLLQAIELYEQAEALPMSVPMAAYVREKKAAARSAAAAEAARQHVAAAVAQEVIDAVLEEATAADALAAEEARLGLAMQEIEAATEEEDKLDLLRVAHPKLSSTDLRKLLEEYEGDVRVCLLATK